MDQLVSIIVPVYNTEKYVEDCIKSILTQTYRHLELILVDDGSRDTSGELCRRWAQKDARVKYVYQENAGVGAARNRGLGMASGEFVSFVDSDDYIVPSFCEKMTDLLGSSGQIVFCEYRELHSDGSVYPGDDHFTMETTTCPSESYEYWKKRMRCSSCMTMYRMELIKDVRFSESLYVGEDMLFVAQAITRAKTLIYLDAPLYVYRILPESAYHGAFEQKKKSEIEAWLQCCEVFPKGSLGRLSAEARCAETCLGMLRTYVNDPGFDEAIIAELVKIYRAKMPKLICHDMMRHRKWGKHFLIGVIPQVYLKRKAKEKQEYGEKSGNRHDVL